ncbi:MAG: hypothetical protein ABJH07_10790 [Sedimentitalea sp.]|uniref:hypothetical protein n=1 Tax=Sedimentitalea sp. TaxID=2048915 RepID=UPI00326747C0
MKHLFRSGLPPLLFVLLVAGCDTSQQSQSRPQSAADALAECVELGFVPGTWEMERCLKADTSVQRLVLVDQATYGTF